MFWIHGGSRVKLEEAYRRIARLLDIPGRDDKDADSLLLVREYLEENASDPWLMILDNADNRDVWLRSETTNAGDQRPLIEYLPRSRHGKMLITTRDSELGFRLTEGKLEPLQIQRFGPVEANKLLRAKLDDGAILSDLDATELTAALEHLPLTITQAAAYLGQIDMSAADYLAEFRAGLSDVPELLSESIDDPLRDRSMSNSVFQAWRLSFEQISLQSPRAAELLSLMSMLDRQEIPKSLIQSPEESSMQFRGAIARLKAFSFVTEDKQRGRYSMHRLVQLSTQRWIEKLGQKKSFAEKAIHAIASATPPDADFLYWTIFTDLQPHVDLALQYQIVSKEAMLSRATVLNLFGRYAIGRGQIELAVKRLDEARQIRRDQLGPDHEDSLTATGQYGVAVGMLSKPNWQQAMEIQEFVLASTLTTLGPEHPLTLKTRSRIAINHSRVNRFKQAKKLHLSVLASMQSTLGPSHTYTLSELSHLLFTLNRLHHWQEALEVGTSALELRTKELGPEHPDTVTIMAQLCMTYNGLKRWNEAVAMEETVLELRLKTLGPEHPKTLLAMEHLGRTLAKKGRAAEAEELLSWVVEVRSKKLGKDHWSVTAVAQSLAKLQPMKQGDCSSKGDDGAGQQDHGGSTEFGTLKAQSQESEAGVSKASSRTVVDISPGLDFELQSKELPRRDDSDIIVEVEDEEEPPPPYSDPSG